MVFEQEVAQVASLDPAVIALHLEATGWRRQHDANSPSVSLWARPSGSERVLYQVVRHLPEQHYIAHTGHLLWELAELEERAPQALLWDLQATHYSRVRFTFHPRLTAPTGTSLLTQSQILGALHQGLRQAALQIERSGVAESFQAVSFLTTLRVLPHDTTDYDLMIGSTEPTAVLVWSTFLDLLGRPATAINPRRELEEGAVHFVMEPLRQAMQATGHLELSGQYLAAGLPNVSGLGLLFRFSSEGGILIGSDD